MQSTYFDGDLHAMLNSPHLITVQAANVPHHILQNGTIAQSNGPSAVMVNGVSGPASSQSVVAVDNNQQTTVAYRCAVCNATYPKMSSVKRHMKIHTKNQVKLEYVNTATTSTVPVTDTESNSPFKCNACKIEYPNATIFEQHIRTEHGQPQALKCSDCGCFRPIALSSVTPFRCETCTDRRGQGFDEAGLIKYRVISNVPQNAIVQPLIVSMAKGSATTTTKIDISSMITTPRMLEQSGRRPRKLHQCMDCGKTYKHQSTLAMHKKVHTGEYKYKCEFCGKEFYLTEYYNRHMRVHTKEKPYQCNTCDKAFSQSNTLTQHKRIHSGEKPYECNVCKKSFSVKDYLMKHIRVHTGEKPFECEICSKKYTQRSGLRTHQKTHFQVKDDTVQHHEPIVLIQQEQFIGNSFQP